jgi:integrase
MLTALRPDDVDFDPRRLYVRRAVEVGRGATQRFKAPKNGLVRTSIFPKSLVDPLHERVEQVRCAGGAANLVFSNRDGGIMSRAGFQRYWIQAAHRAGWPMRTPPRRSAGYGVTSKGWK